jgi:histidinol-phosphate phosphatase family protein
MPKPYLFLDRDDTLIYDVPYLSDPNLIRFTPGACEALRTLSRAGYRLALVTNQSGIARGYFTMEQLEAVHRRLRTLLQWEAVSLDGIFLCPHGPQDDCPCRKPKVGMLLQACQELDVDRARSVMVGDKSADIQMGRNFGLRTVQLALAEKNQADLGADLRVSTLLEAVPVLKSWLAQPRAEETEP